MYYTYIIYSPSADKYYVGSTEDLQRRLYEHNSSRSPYTKSGSPWQLKWKQLFHTRGEALKMETIIKKKEKQETYRMVN